MKRPRIALASADAALRAGLAAYLSEVGHEVRAVAAADHLPASGAVDLLVIDLGPGDDSLDTLRRARDATDAAILALSASRDPGESAAGLEIGADDVVTKPVAFQEIAARIGGILERRGVGRHDLLRLERATVDLAACRLLRHGCPPERLGPGEVVLLGAFARHPNRILSRDDLLDMAAAESLDANDRAVDTRVARLRRKLDTDSIVTVRGHGYMFVPPFERAAVADVQNQRELARRRD